MCTALFSLLAVAFVVANGMIVCNKIDELQA
jgi:nitrate reductase NapE component